MMTNVYYVDFKNRTLIGKKQVRLEPSPRNVEKYEYFCELVDRGLTQVWVDTNVSGVKLPSHLVGNPAAQINWSHKFRLPDFTYDKFKICGTLSFNGQDSYVELPWESIWLMFRPEEGEKSSKVWQDDAPNSVAKKGEGHINEGESS